MGHISMDFFTLPTSTFLEGAWGLKKNEELLEEAVVDSVTRILSVVLLVLFVVFMVVVL